MKKKVVGLLVTMLLFAALSSVAGTINEKNYEDINVQALEENAFDFMKISGNEKTPIKIDYKTNLNPSHGQTSQGTPTYEFMMDPTVIMTSYYDYMPGSYSSHPVRLQTDNGDGKYLTFFGQESTSANRRQYWAYMDSDCNLQDYDVITSYDEWQGYGGIGIHPATGDPIVSWHENIDGGLYETALSYDDFDAAETPGDWQDPLTILATNNLEYIWPIIQVGPSPLGEGYVRVYQTANDYTNLPSGNPCEDVRIMYIDVENVPDADLSVLLDINNWDYVTVFTDWRVKSVRPFQAFAIDYSTPGRVAFMGEALWIEGDLGDMPCDEGIFVWESLDYGETWDYSNLHTNGPQSYLYLVNNPGFEDVPPELDVGFGGHHYTALYDSEGDIHLCFIQSYGYTDPAGSYYFPSIMPQAEAVWDGSEFTYHEVPLLPGTDALSGHSVPWDEEYIYPTVTWSTYPSTDAGLFHENTQKQAVNRENGWMVQMWVDGTYAQLAADDPEFDQNYLEHPIIYLSISIDNGDTWYDPIELTDIYSEEFDFSEQITVYPYICDQITDLGDNWGQIYLYYFDDNEFGSKVHGTGFDGSGDITYCSLKIEFVNAGPEPELDIAFESGISLGINAVIENKGDAMATDVEWTITATGGILGRINKTFSGTIASLTVGESVNISTGMVALLGFGPLEIIARMECAEGESTEETTTGAQILFLTKVI